jgi:hypothetical protein
MGLVEEAIRKAVREGDELGTPIQSQPFRVGRISSDGIILELGQEQTPTFFQWRCLEGVRGFVSQNGRVRINGFRKSQANRAGDVGWLFETAREPADRWMSRSPS